MPPVALRKILAYYGHHTHWTERVEHYLLHLLYYTVSKDSTTSVDIKKLQAATFRNAGGGGGSDGKQSDEEAQLKAEEIAGLYGKHQ